jgi:thiamine pyrophosphate-dependent acetolactate synthase large subunit-like protein
MSQTVADIVVGTLEQIGVKHIFGLIGDSLNPLAEAVRRSKIEWIGVRHEEGAALAAAGQAKPSQADRTPRGLLRHDRAGEHASRRRPL